LSAESSAEHYRGGPRNDTATNNGNSPDSTIRFH